jgi:VWFA-related protein
LALQKTLSLSLASLAFSVGISVGSRGQEPAPATQVPASTTPVRVRVMLTGGKGRAAPEPKREDLRVFVDGVERPVVSFEKEVLPVSYGLVVDNTGSLRTQIARVIGAAKYLVDSNRPGDEAFVLRFVSSDNIKVLQNLTADQVALNKALDSMVIQGGQTALLDALYLAGDYLVKNASKSGAPERRLALILVSDGEDRQSFYKTEDVLKLLRQGGVQVYCVGLTGALENEARLVTRSKKVVAQDLLKKLASETGGRVFYVEKPGQLEEAVGEVVGNMRTRYIIGYEPPAEAAGKGRGKVEVKVVGAPGKENLKAQVVAPEEKKE